tara:strand:- start:79 stop:522 length:444 start_codon:yes stop_codon:yes gene_type:complete
MAYGEMKGLLGSADGVGGIPKPEGLSPQGTKMFYNPSAFNWGEYLLSKGEWDGEDDILYSELDKQGYFQPGLSYDDLDEMEDDYAEGNFWANEIGGILGQNPMHPYGSQDITGLVRNTTMGGTTVPQYERGEANRISQVAKQLLNKR